MRSPLIPLAFTAFLSLAACDRGDPGQIADSGLKDQQTVLEDADVRAENLAEDAAALEQEAAQASGTERQALREEAGAQLSTAARVAAEGQEQADAIGAATERKVDRAER